MRQGATYLGAGRTRFALWAPAQQRVQLLVDDAAPQPMRRGDDGWFELEAPCAPGCGYRYLLDDELAVPDPASRAQRGDVHDASLVVDPRAYAWRHGEWRGRPWHETVLYELHAGCCGGFRGVAARLPALAALGITAIELMPINDFPGARNWGYDGVLPYAPDASYGTPDELKSLIDAAHGLGLMVFLDVVYNHFGPDGNYLHAYAPSFFRADQHTPWGAAIDFRRREVRDYFIDNALYWIHEYRVDGLRFDAVHAIGERDFLIDLARRVRASVEAGRQVHLVLENEHNDAALLGHGARDDAEALYDAQWNDDAHNSIHVLLTGEQDGYYANYADRPMTHLARVLAEGFCYQGEPAASLGGRRRGTPSAQLPPTAFVFFLQNHDQIGNRAFGERLQTLSDADSLRAAIALQLLCPQIPLLFMGEEWGSRTPFLFFTDHHGELAPKVTEGRRAEFAKFAAFADAAQRERIPDPNAASTYLHSVPDAGEAACAEHAAWLGYYGELLALRRRHLTPYLPQARGGRTQLFGRRGVLAQWTLGTGRALSIAAQWDAGEAPLPMLPPGRLLFCSREGALSEATLRGPCCCVFLDEPSESAREST
ncbi:malto-oligosyltrehalose trehalohydrolase [Solimonas soli]|uniref:malto-oligosyltrehalose trehalohydrolase n=1 Tax=Solimonas soli TaxID=413479 RepID=UPI000A074CE3